MKIEYISEFVVLAERKNFLDAADELYVSQSSLSKHIMSMEEELGVRLFNRNTRSVTLTKYGELFLEYAKQIDFLRTKYTAAINGLVNLEHGSITIGTMSNISPYGVTDAIYLFTKTYPNFQLKVIESDTADFHNLLRAGKCDIAFIRAGDDEEKEEEDIKTMLVSRDSLVAVLSSSHPLANRKSLKLIELKDENFILNDPSSNMYRACMKACQEAGFTPKVSYTGHLLDLVGKGIGISLMVKKEVFFINDRLTTVPIEPKIETSFNLCYLKTKELSEAAQYFLDCVKSVTSQQRN